MDAEVRSGDRGLVCGGETMLTAKERLESLVRRLEVVEAKEGDPSQRREINSIITLELMTLEAEMNESLDAIAAGGVN